MSISDRCKEYENNYNFKLTRKLPTFARLDGRTFHTFCKGLKKPFDERLQLCMKNTTEKLMLEFHPLVAYTQSDEITLFWHHEEDYEKENKLLFSGRIMKMASVLSGFTSSIFTKEVLMNLDEKKDKFPHFDCRIWQVPTKGDVLEVFIWREEDATKNSISSAAQNLYSHKELNNKKSTELQELIFKKGINWNDYPIHFKRGLYLKRKRFERDLTFEERSKIIKPQDKIIRSKIIHLDIEPIRKLDKETAFEVIYG